MRPTKLLLYLSVIGLVLGPFILLLLDLLVVTISLNVLTYGSLIGYLLFLACVSHIIHENLTPKSMGKKSEPIYNDPTELAKKAYSLDRLFENA